MACGWAAGGPNGHRVLAVWSKNGTECGIDKGVLEQKSWLIGLKLGYYLPMMERNLGCYTCSFGVVSEYFLCHYVILFDKMSYLCIV